MNDQNKTQETELNASDIKPEDVPGFDLSFELLKDVLKRQCDSRSIYDSKALAIFTVGTAIIGLGLGIPLGSARFSSEMFFSSPYGWLTIIFYGVMAILTVITVWPTTFFTEDDPKIIREYYWDLVPFQFKLNMLLYIEKDHQNNQQKLMIKGRAIQFMVPAIFLETIFLLLFLIFVI